MPSVAIPKNATCPRCGSKELQLVEHKGHSYPQCKQCHFWSTSNKVDETWQRKTSS